MKKLLLFAALCAGVIAVSGAVYAHLHDDALAPKLTYWSDGAVKSSVVYVDGSREGAREQWYPSGVTECRGAYSHGAREGPWTFWNEDGSIDQERSGEYREGKRVAQLGN